MFALFHQLILADVLMLHELIAQSEDEDPLTCSDGVLLFASAAISWLHAANCTSAS